MIQTAAIIVGAGASSRFGADVPKQFVSLLGKPLLAHTIARFRSCPAVSRIVVVLPHDGFESHRALIQPFIGAGDTLVAGGDTRQASAWAGLEVLDIDPDGLVAVHDGARPLVESALIERVAARTAETGAAIAAVPVVETLKEVDPELAIRRTVDRKLFYRAQTPQCFRARVLVAAFEAAQSQGYVGTDEAALVERTGVSISIVEGSEHNIKVTTSEDLARVEYFLKRVEPPVS